MLTIAHKSADLHIIILMTMLILCVSAMKHNRRRVKQVTELQFIGDNDTVRRLHRVTLRYVQQQQINLYRQQLRT